MEVVTPGTRLGSAKEFRCGEGTYKLRDHIFASRVGVKQVAGAEAGQPRVISVESNASPKVVPKIGDVVTGKVTRVTPRLMQMRIACVGAHALHEDFAGVVRVESVRAHDIDKVEIYDSFRPGDVVRAEVISLGDLRSYALSTAKPELGVVLAKSVAGGTMVALNHEEMQCPLTNAVEKRKVAKRE